MRKLRKNQDSGVSRTLVLHKSPLAIIIINIYYRDTLAPGGEVAPDSVSLRAWLADVYLLVQARAHSFIPTRRDF